jgi:hypothetical protein
VSAARAQVDARGAGAAQRRVLGDCRDPKRATAARTEAVVLRGEGPASPPARERAIQRATRAQSRARRGAGARTGRWRRRRRRARRAAARRGSSCAREGPRGGAAHVEQFAGREPGLAGPGVERLGVRRGLAPRGAEVPHDEARLGRAVRRRRSGPRGRGRACPRRGRRRGARARRP